MTCYMCGIEWLILTPDKIVFILDATGCLYSNLVFGCDLARSWRPMQRIPGVPDERQTELRVQADASVKDALEKAAGISCILAANDMLYGSPLGGLEHLLRFWKYDNTPTAV